MSVAIHYKKYDDVLKRATALGYTHTHHFTMLQVSRKVLIIQKFL